MRHLRAAWRLGLLAFFVTLSLPQLLAARSLAARAAWLHIISRRTLRLLGARVVVRGPVPVAGLVVSNHLGYLDVLVFASALPAVFVAKSDVRRWPVVGWLCARAGTIFVERGRRTPVRLCLDRVLSALRAGNAVILFPEGTSSGGAEVLPFKTSLLAAGEGHPVAPVAVGYRMTPGKRASEELCYWRDMTFAPHLWNVLSNPGFVATLRFGPPCAAEMHRKPMADLLRAEVINLQRNRPAESFAATRNENLEPAALVR